MLESVKISRRQSEIRVALAALVGKTTPSDDEVRSMGDLDKEYATNEVRYRASLVAEDNERREAGRDLETRDGKQWSDLVGAFEVRQIVGYFDEGRELSGQTKEVCDEMRSKGSYRGLPCPWEAFAKREVRAGETIASGTPLPVSTMPILDRIFADAAFSRMGVGAINIDHGSQDYPIVSSSVSASWLATETTGASPTVYSTSERSVAPNSTLATQVVVTRKALKQSGDGLEAAIRRDLNGCMGVALDAAVFLGLGASGQPAGLLVGSYGITSTAINAPATWAAFRSAVTRFLVANAANSPGDVRLMIRPEIFDFMDGTASDLLNMSEWDRLIRSVPLGNIVMTSNALAAPTGGPPTASKALLTVVKNGVPPAYLATWGGGADLIRDPFTQAGGAGSLTITALTTADVTATRAPQLEILTGVQNEIDEGS